MLIGDWMRSSKPYLEKVINAGIRSVIYDSDADYICNHQSVENMVNVSRHKYSSQYASAPWTSWTVSGVPVGQLKNSGPLSCVRVFQCIPGLKLRGRSSPPDFQGWSPGSRLHRRGPAIREACYARPGDGWQTNLLGVDTSFGELYPYIYCDITMCCK